MKINVNNYAKTGVRHFGRSGFVHTGVLPLNFYSYKLRFWLPLRFIPKAILLIHGSFRSTGFTTKPYSAWISPIFLITIFVFHRLKDWYDLLAKQ